MRTWPRKTGLNCSIPAIVSSTVGSSGTSEELGRILWPRAAKKSCGRGSEDCVAAVSSGRNSPGSVGE